MIPQSRSRPTRKTSSLSAARDSPTTPLKHEVRLPADDLAEDATDESAAAVVPGDLGSQELHAKETDETPDWNMLDVAPYRFVLLTPRCPLLVELCACAEGTSMDAAAEHAAERLLPYLDRNRDHRISWDEVAESGLVNQFTGGMQVPRGRQRDLLFRSYDSDADETVDPHELIPFINRGRASRNWLVVRSSPTVATTFDSALAHVLDRNGDQQLDEDEIEDAPQRLMMLDADDDGILLSGEFQSAPDDARMIREPSRGSRGAPVFFLTDQEPDFGELLFRLQEQFALGAPLFSENLRDWPLAWQALDADGDGVVWDDELRMLLDGNADVTIKSHIELKTNGVARNLIRVESTAGQVVRHSEQFTEIDFAHDMMRITIPPAATDVGDNYISAIMDRADANADQQLSASEFENLRPLGVDFQLLDEDADGLLTKAEIEQLLSIFADMSRLRLELVLQSSGDALFAAMDRNRDGRLSVTEIAQSVQSLRTLDRNGDTRIVPDESNPGFDISLRPGTAPGPVSPGPTVVDERRQKMRRPHQTGFRRWMPTTTGPCSAANSWGGSATSSVPTETATDR